MILGKSMLLAHLVPMRFEGVCEAMEDPGSENVEHSDQIEMHQAGVNSMIRVCVPPSR